MNMAICSVFEGVLGTRFGSLELEIESLESEKIGFLAEIREIGSLQSIRGT